MIALMLFILGFVFGVLAAVYASKNAIPSGDLIITHDEDGYYLTAKLNESPESMKKRKIALFKVKDISQK